MGSGEGPVGDLPGNVITGEEQRIQEVYRDWMHSNDGAHTSGGIQDKKEWQTRWKPLAVMTTRRYDAPSRRVKHRFVHALTMDLTGVLERRWNAERFIVFQTVIIQRARNNNILCKIRQQIDQRLDAWEGGEHKMLAEDKYFTFEQYLSAIRGEDPL